MNRCILPLVKKDGLPEIAKEIIEELKWEYSVVYDEKDAVGRRYRRQDAAGTPFCITVDHQTKEDQTVTIRHRDTMEQQRISIPEVSEKLKETKLLKRIGGKTFLSKLASEVPTAANVESYGRIIRATIRRASWLIN